MSDPAETVEDTDPQEGRGPEPTTLEEVVSGIGAKVRLMRTRKGYSLQQLANVADVSAAAIHKIERNGMVPTITTLMKLAAALNRPVSYFISEDEEGDKPAVHTTPEKRRSVFTTIPGLDLQSISGPYVDVVGANPLIVMLDMDESGQAVEGALRGAIGIAPTALTDLVLGIELAGVRSHVDDAATAAFQHMSEHSSCQMEL